MITNERQYKITKSQADIFLSAIKDYCIDDVIKNGVHPLIAQAQLDQLKSEYEILINQLEEYDQLSAGLHKDFESTSLEDLPLILIKARISHNWTQKILAEALGLKEQQIQRYESELYRTCNLATLIRIAETLNLKLADNAVLSIRDEIETNSLPFTDMFNRGWFEDFRGSLSKAKRSKDKLIESFFINSGVTQVQLSLHKKNVRSGSTLDEYALSAWQARILYKTKHQKLDKKFKLDDITQDWFRELAKLSQHSDGPIQAREFLLASGIHFVVERQLPKTHLDGAAIRRPDGSPVIACTLRHDRLDNFWFVLLHELAHMYLHFQLYTDTDFFDDLDQQSNDIENEADEFALNALVPDNEWNKCLSRFSLNISTIREEARKLQIHPSILAGRIRHEQNNYTILNDAVGRGEVREQLEKRPFDYKTFAN